MHERVPQRASSEGAEFAPILYEARRVLQSVRQQIESLQRRAYKDGRAAGFARAQIESAEHVLTAQRKARAFVEDSELHIVGLAISIVAGIAPRLGEGSLVAAMLAEALNTMVAERELRVSVTHDAVTATRAMLAGWQQAHPTTMVLVLVDPRLSPFDCVIEAAQGRVELSLHSQLEAVRAELLAARPLAVRK
jgi:flagellar biosynthesis/type III secretory pathway protein FliH